LESGRYANPPVQHYIEQDLFQKRANGDNRSSMKQLFRAFEIAKETDNHHFRYWLVRNYAGVLCCGRAAAFKSSRSGCIQLLGKRKLDT
jgi:hypothetical protein